MRLTVIACLTLVCTAVMAEPAASAESSATSAVACDNLITLRRLMAEAPEADRIPAELGGCRTIPADRIGAVEKRAMIGDAPYECRNVKDGPCLWIRP